MGSAVLGSIGLAIEALTKQGEQSLLPRTLYGFGTGFPTSLTTQPSGSTGMRLHVRIDSYTGTTGIVISIAGLSPSGSSITENINVANPVYGQNGQVVAFDYVTQNVFASVSANGITATNLSTGYLTIGGIPAAKYLISCDFEGDIAFEQISPNEYRGSYETDFNIVQTRRVGAVSKFDQELYPENSLWFWYMIVNASPTITTLPASPTVLLAATNVLASMSLTTQPASSPAGQRFIILIAGASAAGTIGITGVNNYGQTVTESMSVSGNGTYYSANRYVTVNANGITTTGLTGGTIAISGVFGWQYVFVPDATSTPYTAAIEFFDGTDSLVCPFTAMDEGTIEFDVEKDAKLTSKHICQDMLPIGDRTTNPMNQPRVLALAQPLDLPLVGTSTQTFIDPLSGTPLTTAYADLLNMKFDIKWNVVGKWTSLLSQVFNRIYRKKRQMMISGSVDFTNLAQWEAFRQNRRQYFGFQMIGSFLGAQYSKSVTIVCAAKYKTWKRKGGVDKENVEADFEGTCEYDPTLGASYKVTVVCDVPPTYTA